MKILITVCLLLVTAGLHAQTLTPKCETPTAKGDSSCWLKVNNHGDCYVWNERPQSQQQYTWSGQCHAGKPDGHGEEVWQNSAESSLWFGTYKDGKRHGPWEVRDANGTVKNGPYRDGKRLGQWEFRYPNGDVQIGLYTDNRRHGQWIVLRANNTPLFAIFEQDELISGQDYDKYGNGND